MRAWSISTQAAILVAAVRILVAALPYWPLPAGVASLISSLLVGDSDSAINNIH
jgi:hypothetical protein